MDDSAAGQGGAGAELDGTFYLNNLWVADTGHILLNSISNYRNGVVNEDFFNGTTISPDAIYRINGDFLRVLGGDNSTVHFAISSGTGSEATDPNNEIAGIQIAINDIDTGAILEMETFSFEVSGADLIAAGGQLNLLVDLTNTTEIPGFPGSVAAGDIANAAIISQVRVDNISIDINLPGDANDDFSVDAADLAIWEANFGDPIAPHGPGDFNGNGQGDGLDFLLWQRNFTGSLSPVSQTVPEPSSIVLLTSAFLGLCYRAQTRKLSGRR